MPLSHVLTTSLMALLISLPATRADDVVAEDDAASTIKLTEAPWSEVEKQVGQFPGKLVVVDLWSTACLPCMEEFPGLVQLQKHYGDRIVCISVNVNYAGIKSRPPEYYRPKVEKFLAAQDAQIRNYLCSTEANDIFEQVKLNSIPAVFVFGKDGKLLKRFDDSLLVDGREEAFTYKDDIHPFVESVLSKP